MTLLIGTDDAELGRLFLRDGRVDAAPDAAREQLFSLFDHYALQLAVGGSDPDAITPADVLRRMAERMTGRTWALASASPPATFAESPPDFTPAGPDGARAVRLLATSRAASVDTLTEVADRAVRRLLMLPPPYRSAHLFEDDELHRIAGALAGSIATADLLGRSRVRRRAELAEARAALPVAFAEVSDDPWHDFDEAVPAVEPQAAVDYFRRLVPSLGTDPGRYGPMLARHALTLAVATEQTLIQRVQDAITAALRTGFDATPDVQDILDAAGVSPRHPQYAEMVVRTNQMDALNTGAMAEMQTPEMQTAFPVWRYDGIVDSRTGEDHRPLIGRHYPVTAAFADVRGPRVYNCRCSPTPVYRTEAAELIRAGKVERG